MTRVGVFAIHLVAALLAVGCGKGGTKPDAPPAEQPTPPVPDTITLPKSNLSRRIDTMETAVFVSMTADGRLLFRDGKEKATEISLAALRKKIEEVAKANAEERKKADPPKGDGETGDRTIVMELPKEKPEPKEEGPKPVIVKVEADDGGAIKVISPEVEGIKLELRTVDAYRDWLKGRVAPIASMTPRLILALDGRLKQLHVIQLIDTAIRSGFTDVSPEVELFGRPAPKLAPLGDDPGGNPIEGAPVVVLRIHEDVPFAAAYRLMQILRGWGAQRIQLRANMGAGPN